MTLDKVPGHYKNVSLHSSAKGPLHCPQVACLVFSVFAGWLDTRSKWNCAFFFTKQIFAYLLYELKRFFNIYYLNVQYAFTYTLAIFKIDRGFHIIRDVA